MKISPYPFEETLAQLDEIIAWLRSIGHAQHDRIRIYRKHISDMIALQDSGNYVAEAFSADKRREIMCGYVEADEFVRAVGPLRACLGDSVTTMPIDRALEGPADPLHEHQDNSHGRNFMFELIMAGRFARAGIVPSFDRGPDVAVTIDGVRISIQCKRPLSVSGIKNSIRKAVSQLRDDDADLRLIAVSMSRFLADWDPGSRRIASSADAAQAYLDGAGRFFADCTGPLWWQKLERAGILFYGFAPMTFADGSETPKHVMLRTETLCPLDSQEETKARLRQLHSRLGA